MNEKVSDRFIKSIKENKNKKGILSVIKVKLKLFQDSFDLSKQKIIDDGDWIVKKIDATSLYGHYRIIVAQNTSSDKLVYDFYFKNNKEDMKKDEIRCLKDFLIECADQNFYDRLTNFSDC